MSEAKSTNKRGREKKHHLRYVLFGLSVLFSCISLYLVLDFQASSDAKLSGDLILGQVDSASYEYHNSPIIGFFFEYCGVLSYPLCCLIAYVGYWLFLRPVDIWHINFYKAGLRWLGINLLILGLAALLSHYVDLGSTGGGGLLGDMLNMFCDYALPEFVSVILFLIVTYCGLSFFFAKSPLFFFDRVGQGFFTLMPKKQGRHARHEAEDKKDPADAGEADTDAEYARAQRNEPSFNDGFQDQREPSFGNEFAQAQAQDQGYQDPAYAQGFAASQQKPAAPRRRSLFDEDGEAGFIDSPSAASAPSFGESKAPAFAQEHSEGQHEMPAASGVDFFNTAQNAQRRAAAVHQQNEINAVDDNSTMDDLMREHAAEAENSVAQPNYNNLALGDLPLEKQIAEETTYAQEQPVAYGQNQEMAEVTPFTNTNSYGNSQSLTNLEQNFGDFDQSAFNRQNQPQVQQGAAQTADPYAVPQAQDAYAAPQGMMPQAEPQGQPGYQAPAQPDLSALPDLGFQGSRFEQKHDFSQEPAFAPSIFQKESENDAYSMNNDDFESLPQVSLVDEPAPKVFKDTEAQAFSDRAQPETVPESGAALEAPVEEESSPYITPGSSRALREESVEEEETSPYITPGVEREEPVQAEDAPETEENKDDDGPVHTLIQRVDPSVFAAQQAKIRAEREAAAAQAQKEREEREAREQAEREAREAEEQRRAAEAEAAAAQAAEQARKEAEAQARQQQEEQAAAEAAQEEEEFSPYMGTYASSLHQPDEKAKKSERDLIESAAPLAEPNTHEIGVHVHDEADQSQPHTIIQKVDPAVFAEQQAQIRAERAAAEAAAKRRLEEEQAAAEAEEQARLAAEAARAAAEEERLAQEQAAYEAQNYAMPELSADAQAKSDALASEMQSMQGEGEFSISSLVSRAREQNGDAGSTNQFERAAQQESESEDFGRPSTIISRGSGAGNPSVSGDGFDRFNNRDSDRTSIIRSGSGDDGVESDFKRFAMNNDQGSSGAVAVNMFDESEDLRPSSSFNFGSSDDDEFDESFVAGNSHKRETPRIQKGFSFADIAREKGGEEAVSRVPGEDNIFAFSKFDEKKAEPKSYEIGHLSSSFIPISGDGSGDEDRSIEEQMQARALREKMRSLGADVDADAPQSVPASLSEADSEAEASQAKASAVAATPASSTALVEAKPASTPAPEEDEDDEEEGEDEQYSNYFDPQQQAQMAQMQQAQAMPQYVQLPNGQFVPMMPNTMAMYPGMQMQNMPQYIQMPNGQYVPAQMYQQMMQQNMMANQMAQMQQMQMQQAQMAQMAQMQQMQMQQAGVMPQPEMSQPYAEPDYGAPEQGYAAEQMQGQPAEPESQQPSVPEQQSLAQPQAEENAGESAAPAGQHASDPHLMGEHGARGVGLPTAGNAFGGAHNSSSSNLPSYMAGVTQGVAASFDQPQSLSLCSVPRHHFDGWLPDQSILAVSHDKVEITEEDLNHTAERINEVLHSYGVKASVADYLTGPVITRFDLDLAPGVKSSAIVSIETELCRNLLVPNVRVVPIIEGSSYVGLEVPNAKRQFITLGDMVSSREFQESKASLPMLMGASVVGKPVVKDLAETPHLLVAGTTGSGKSAGLNTILISLLLKCSPAELRLILVDPKQLEFSIYRDLPHLITPVITDVAEQTPIALHWCVEEMERRFKLMSMLGVRKLAEYNKMVRDAAAHGRAIPDPLWTAEMGPQPQALKPLPWIVIVVEEFADLMAQSSRKKDKDKTAEGYIARLTAKSRAAGIHLVLVTQTPRSEVVNGMIKANIPSRIAFTVQNRIDSNIVLDEKGAECLLGNGDMLYKFSGSNMATRAHGAFTSNDDVKNIVSAWRNQAAPEYLEDVIAVPPDEDAEAEADAEAAAEQKLDVKFDAAAAVAREYLERRNKPPSITDLQNDLGVGFPRAKKIYKQLIKEGVLEE